MSAAARLNDSYLCPISTHLVKKITQGSDNVFINHLAAARMDDTACCEKPNDNTIIQGSSTIFINKKPLARVGDMLQHGGIILTGSNNVIIEQHLSITAISKKPIANKQNLIGKKEYIPRDAATRAKDNVRIQKVMDRMPENIKDTLKNAMRMENIPANQYNYLLWIMAHESSGRINIRNLKSTARGLFQLTEANYHFNPNRKDSFGNSLEECIGGIRYIKSRYQTPEKAVAFWEDHEWY